MDATYRVANHNFRVLASDECKPWLRVKSHYEPFACAADEVLYTVEIVEDDMPDLEAAGYRQLINEKSDEPGSMGIAAYIDADGNTAYAMGYVGEDREAASQCALMLNPSLTQAKIVIAKASVPHSILRMYSLTTSMLLCYSLCTSKTNTLVAHSSCAVCQGKAFLFIAKSGTGKSTHCGLWLKHVAGAWQLNDDHPVVRVADDGVVMAYGSPWSGKTDVYINDQYPIGAIVRISRANHNAIKRLSPIEAYASLSTSFSGIKWNEEIADKRHQTLELIVTHVPCYTLSCLPDAEAAAVCSQEVLNLFKDEDKRRI